MNAALPHVRQPGQVFRVPRSEAIRETALQVATRPEAPGAGVVGAGHRPFVVFPTDKTEERVR